MPTSFFLRRPGAWIVFAILSSTAPVHADEMAPRLTAADDFQPAPALLQTPRTLLGPDAQASIPGNPQTTPNLLERAGNSANEAVNQALDLVGIRYRRGGTSPETGFDCSGFVGHVFREGIGLILPRSSKEISRSGEVIKKNELQPGDLVFFNTMRRTFSHVGIYLGNNRFIHSPAKGGEVRVEDMNLKYWVKRFNGARRLTSEQ